MMTFKDFFEIAKYANEAWRGFFSDEEIAETAHEYTICYMADGIESDVIKSLIERLNEDASDEAQEFIERLA